MPAWLQAWRGSHIVITTIMFNFVAAALMVYLLVNVLIAPGSMTPQSRNFAAAGSCPRCTTARRHRHRGRPSPLNLSLVAGARCAASASGCSSGTRRWGYELRAMGHNPEAAVYAGIQPARA